MKKNKESDDLFMTLKESLLNIDPVNFCEKYLTLDGKPFRLNGNGYKPLADIYRYIGIKALEPNAPPVILVKGRQIGATTMAAALEMYFMGSGLFGAGDTPPIRIMHTFPQLEFAAAYSKTKLSAMINQSIQLNSEKPGVKTKSYMQSLLDNSSSTNDSLSFKQFVNGNHIWIESIGLTGDRVIGRQLCLETELPTPTGFIKLKDLKEGDQLFDEKGNVCNVTKLYPINISPESYKITFDDGTIVDACAEHLWLTYTRRDRIKLKKIIDGKIQEPPKPTIKNTKEILQTLKVEKNKKSNHSIPNCLPLNYGVKNLPLDPYLLGLWLGDGARSEVIESADPEIFEGYDHYVIPSSIKPEKSKSCSYRIVGLTTKLIQLGLIKNTHNKKNQIYNKHIPDVYMYSSFEDRIELLKGLLDSDGHCTKNGMIEFSQVRKELTKQVYELILSLGIKARLKKVKSTRYEKSYSDKYKIFFVTKLPVFKMKRKLSRLKKDNKSILKITHRFIKKIEPIPSKPMRCITVDSSSHLYLITRKFIPTHNTCDIMLCDETQKTTTHAIGNASKILTTAKYGRPGKGVQFFFGTPRKKGSDYHKMWQSSTQQYYHLGCEKCQKHFPLYTPESDDWEKIWIHGFIVKCPLCGQEQDKRDAAERGKWISLKSDKDEDCKMIGFHLNQLYIPLFKREDIENEKPGIHHSNTETIYRNEVLGEFFQGDSTPITSEEIRELCGDFERKFRAKIIPGEEQIVVLGIDYGAKSDLEQMAKPDAINKRGQSYSTAVVLVAKGPDLLSIEYATKFKRNDPESKKGLIDQILRQYSVQLAIGDIGFSNDFSVILHNMYGDKYLVSRAHPKVNNHVKFNTDAFPKEIIFERDYYIGELYEKLKQGKIRFPFGDYEKVGWLIEHCSSMEIKPSISRIGEHGIHYVKGSSPNDGFMALLNAYIAYKFLITKGFTYQNTLISNIDIKNNNKPLILSGYIPRRM